MAEQQDEKRRRKLAGEIATFLATERRLDSAGDELFFVAYTWFGKPGKQIWEQALIMAVQNLREYVRMDQAEAELAKPVPMSIATAARRSKRGHAQPKRQRHAQAMLFDPKEDA